MKENPRITQTEGGFEKKKKKRRKSVQFEENDVKSQALMFPRVPKNIKLQKVVPKIHNTAFFARAKAKTTENEPKGINSTRSDHKNLKPLKNSSYGAKQSLTNLQSGFTPIAGSGKISPGGKNCPDGKISPSRKSSLNGKIVLGNIPAVISQIKGGKNAKENKKWPFVDFGEQMKMDDSKEIELAKLQPMVAEPEHECSSYEFEIKSILSSVEEQQKRRHQEHVRGELAAIKKRINANLEELGMESDSDSDPEKEPLKSSPIHFFDTSGERKKMEERMYILDKIESFEEKAVVRKQYLTEVMFWFGDNHDLAADVCTPEELREMVNATQDIHQTLCSSLTQFITAGDNVVEKGRLLLNETSKIIEERRAQMAKKTKKERIIVYDDKTLLSDRIKWENAGKTIISVFEDSQKMIKNPMFKNALRLCQKQFDFIVLACDQRYKDLNDKKKQCTELKGKLHSAKVLSDKLHKEIEEQRKRMVKLTQDMSSAKLSLDNMTEKNNELHRKISELNSKVKFLQDELQEKNKIPTPPPTPPPPEPEKIYVKVVDSATELRLKDVETELASAKVETEALVSELNEVKEDLVLEQQKTNLLQEKIVELEARELAPPAPIIPTLPPPPEIPPPPELPADKDASYYKTLMVGMKRDFEIEMEKVKSHVRKETRRGEASMKKMEYQHRDQLAYIQKDTVRMLRAIMHFRDHMLTCMEKENLIDQAQQLHDIGDIIKDKLSPDPKEVLATIVGTVVDYLNKMEGILSSSFLAMRILMKYQVEKIVEHEMKQRLAMREVQKKDKEMKSQKKNVIGLANCLKKAKAKLKKAKKNVDNFASDKKYLDLLSRYKQMMKTYKNMQKEMEVLNCDFHDTMQKKLEEKETMVISQLRMEMKQKKVLAEEQLKMSISDQRENIRRLGRAYEENKISKDLHVMATAMLQKTIEIPRRKLKNFFEQYITYRTVQDSKVRVARVLKDEKAILSIDTRTEMENYLESIEGKYVTNMKKWRESMRNLETEKKDLHRKIFKLFNEVLLETGILLVHPLMKSDKPKAHTMLKAASCLSRGQVQRIILRKKKRCKDFLMLPAELLGKSMPLGHRDHRYWRRQSLESSQNIAPSVSTPHMLAYEVNKPRIIASRSLQRGRQAFIVGRTESFHISDMHHVQYIRNIPYHHRQQMEQQDVLAHQFESDLLPS